MRYLSGISYRDIGSFGNFVGLMSHGGGRYGREESESIEKTRFYIAAYTFRHRILKPCISDGFRQSRS